MTSSEYATQLPGMEDPPDARTVRELVDRFGFKETAVRGWGRSRAVTTLEGKRKEEAILLRKQAAKAGEDAPGHAAARSATAAAKADAAAYLEHAIAATGVDQLHLAVSYAVFDLDADEIRRLAGWLIKRFRGEA